MILLDTSVLVSYIKRPTPAVREVFASLDCAVCGIIRAEILHGARSPEDVSKLKAALDCFTCLPTDESIWDVLGQHLATLRAAGLPMPIQDSLIATLAIHHNAELWTYDNHFASIRSVLPKLRLFSGPQG